MGKTTQYPADAKTGELLRSTVYWSVRPADPFSYYGSSFDQKDYGPRDGVWKDNTPFNATMTFAGAADGMFYWRDDATGLPWAMFPTEMSAILGSGALSEVKQGEPVKIAGTFDVTKRSTRYGLRWLGH